MRDKTGFTLIETLMVISLIGILAALSMIPIGDTLDQKKYDITVNQMNLIRSALLGEMSANPAKSRFGFLGDLGALPTSVQGLKALWEIPADIESWKLSPEFRTGSGWSGPYLTDQGTGGVDYTKDAWGNPYLYDPDSDPATLTSYGADQAAGGTGLNSDITLTIPKARQQYTLHGLILKSGGQWSGSLDVELNVPDPTTGTLATRDTTISSGDQGAFVFNKVPPGVRSLTLYLPSKAHPGVTYGPYIVTVDQPHTLVIYGTAEHPLDLSAAP